MELDEEGAQGFFFVPPFPTAAWAEREMRLRRLFWPLLQLDFALGNIEPPGCFPIMGMGPKDRITARLDLLIDQCATIEDLVEVLITATKNEDNKTRKEAAEKLGDLADTFLTSSGDKDKKARLEREYGSNKQKVMQALQILADIEHGDAKIAASNALRRFEINSNPYLPSPVPPENSIPRPDHPR